MDGVVVREGLGFGFVVVYFFGLYSTMYSYRRKEFCN
jgi:hypothetical protein